MVLVSADAEVIPGVMQALIEQVRYDGPSGAVAVTLRAPTNSPIEPARVPESAVATPTQVGQNARSWVAD